MGRAAGRKASEWYVLVVTRFGNTDHKGSHHVKHAAAAARGNRRRDISCFFLRNGFSAGGSQTHYIRLAFVQASCWASRRAKESRLSEVKQKVSSAESVETRMVIITVGMWGGGGGGGGGFCAWGEMKMVRTVEGVKMWGEVKTGREGGTVSGRTQSCSLMR